MSDVDSLFGSPYSSSTELEEGHGGTATAVAEAVNIGQTDPAKGLSECPSLDRSTKAALPATNDGQLRPPDRLASPIFGLVASRSVPDAILGLHVFPDLLPRALEGEHTWALALWSADRAPYLPAKLLVEIARSNIFLGGRRDQAMFFSSASEPPQATPSEGIQSSVEVDVGDSDGRKSATGTDGVPSYLQAVPQLLADLLAPERETSIAAEEWETLFSSSRPELVDEGRRQPSVRQRQYILNLYKPSQGITPHIDLPDRYEDGIVGICFGSGCVMDFTRSSASADPAESHSVYLPPRTVYTMTGPARWEWKHGIPARDRDRVEVEAAESGGAGWQTLLRDVRVSITLRWMREGANVVGPETKGAS